ncbi:MAG: carboxypeptidase regulatory-like domain-containing protein [Planctomycetia bacterium]|nr:carboxypeptidase regulatory-like domain-containing protein [Planctomycetia bacterium]
MSRRARTLGIAFVLLAGVAAAWFASRRDADAPSTEAVVLPGTQGPVAPAPLAASGRAPAAPAGPSAGDTAKGAPGVGGARPGARPPALVVVGPDGAPRSRALVVRCAKGADAVPGPIVMPEAEEARVPWSSLSPKGAWLAVRDSASRIVVIDGDGVDVEADREVRLEPAVAIAVTVTRADGRTPVPFAAVEVTATPQVGGARDGPPASLFEPLLQGILEVGEDGRGSLFAGLPGPVRVAMVRSDWNVVADPAYVDLPAAEGEARFRIMPACKLAIRVTDAATRRPLAVPFRVTTTGPDGGPTGGSTTNPEATGVFELFPNLRPGVYTIVVEADGYLSSASVRVELREFGDAATHDVALRAGPAPAVASLRLHLPVAGAPGPTWWTERPPATKAPALLARPAGDPRGAWGELDLAGDATWDAEARVWTLPRARPGRYDIFVFDAARGEVGSALGVEVVASGVRELSVPLSAGVPVSIRVDGAGATFRDVSVESPDGVRWPLVTQTSAAEMSWSDVLDELSETTSFVPVPGERALLRWKDAHGTTRERALP